MCFVRWLVLDRLMEAGLAFQRKKDRLSQRKQGEKAPTRSGRLGAHVGKRLKEKEPW